MQSGERIVLEGREYRLGSVLSTGAGSYGQVWAAADAAGRAVALKFVNAEAMSQADNSLRGHWRAHLEREIDFLAGLTPAQSRHIVALLDHGQLDGQPVLVLERLQCNLGQWLAQRRQTGAPPPDLAQILDWAEQILTGLEVIHQAGFVYRDLKLSNILVGAQGSLLKLADFGSLKRENGDSTRSFIGTPATMAPEQLLPARRSARGCEYAVDFRADYYALGLLLFTLLTEAPATAAQRRLGQLLTLHGQEGVGRQSTLSEGLNPEERESVRRAIEFWTVPARPERVQHGVAPPLIDLLDRLLARDPADRPASGAAIRAVLREARIDQPHLPPPLVIPDEWTSPPDSPPNRHPRRAGSSIRRPRSARVLGLLVFSAAAAAIAWAVAVRPVMMQEASEPANTAPAVSSSAVSSDRPAVASPSTPAPEPQPLVIVPPAPPTPSSPAFDTASTAPARPEPPKSPDSSETETASESVATATPERNAPEPVTPPEALDSTAATAGERAGQEPAPTTAAAEAEPDGGTGVEHAPPTEQSAPIAGSGFETDPPAPAPAKAPPAAPARASRLTPARPPRFAAPSKTGEPPKRIEASKAEASAPPAISKKALIGDSAKTVKAAPAKPEAGGADANPPPSGTAAPVAKTLAVKPETSASSSRAPAPARPEPARFSPAPVPARTVSIAKPAPKPATVQPGSARLTARAAKPAAPAPQPAKPAPAVARERPASKIASPPVRERVAPKLAAARPSSDQTVSPVRRLAPLPPIDLVSNINGAVKAAPPAQAPIELVSRSRPAPPIELVSRPNPAPATAPSRTVPPVSSAASPNPQTTHTIISKRSARVERATAAPDLRRQAENFGNWVGRASASVGTEIQRGLDSANQALGGLTGQCGRADGCGARPVLRRDRWSPANRGALPR
ncbi:MAG: protein kinase [Candidatus Competibacteraceae bacterium]|nr:protein kinase [Candidatus Competibacteraceae bacterium]